MGYPGIQEGRRSPTFSVVIPTYNRADLLPRAVGSVLGQTMGDFELLVVDDGSVDTTREVIEGFRDSRVRYLRQENAGAPSARNHGARLARGRYITFLDSDDEALPDWLETLTKTFEEQEADIVCCGFTRVEGDGPDAQVRNGSPRDLGRMFNHALGLFTNGGVFAVRLDAFREVGGYAEGLRSGQHSELAMRLLPEAERRGWVIQNVMRPLVRIWVHSGPRIRGNPEAVFAGSSYTLRAHRELFKRDPARRARYHAIAAVNGMRLGKRRESLHHFVQAVRSNPFATEHWARLLVALPALALGRPGIWAASDSAD